MKRMIWAALLLPAVSFARDPFLDRGLALPASGTAFGLESPPLPQAKPPDPEVDPKAVNAAIDKGAQWLLNRFPQNRINEQRYTELVLLTLVHAGVPPEHPILRDNFQRMVDHHVSETYNAGLRALLLEKVNRKFYQQTLAEIAQFFMENQCDNGQWAYTGKSRKLTPTVYAPVPTPAKKKIIPGATQTMDEGPQPGKDLKLAPPVRGTAKKSGDNSNTQYAVLALFAASRAGVVVPKSPWQEVERWFETKQNPDGGWGYDSAEVPGVGRVTTDASTGSMTTAALTGLIVSKFYLGKEWKTEASVRRGLDWLGKFFAVNANPGFPAIWHYYYLYGLERVGTISGLEDFGGHRWYKEGAEYLIKMQDVDGSWKSSTPVQALTDPVTDTCFAILFLKRATPPLQKPKDIATGVSKKDEEPAKAGEQK
jgi:hypothetical protein